MPINVFKPGMRRPQASEHLVSRNWSCPLNVCACLCLSVCQSVSVCPPQRLVITSAVIWTPYDWLKKYYSFCMAAIVSIVSRHCLRIKARCRNQPNKSKLLMYKPFLCLYSHLSQPYISNKMKRFSYKNGCQGVCMGVHVSRHLKEELGWSIDKRLRVVINKMLLKIDIPLRN